MRKLGMVLRVALSALVSHKLRSFLTMLGIIIGVGAVIALVAVGQGAQAQIVNQFQSLGSNLLMISPAYNFGFSRAGARQNVRQLNNADVEAIRGLATSVALIAPEYDSNNATVAYNGKTTSVGLTGVTPEYETVRNWTVSLGSFITKENNDNLDLVVVLGQTVLSDLFGSTNVNPIGETVRINRQNYTVVGVLKAKGTGGNSNQDDVVFMPLRVAQLKLGGAGTTTLRSINLSVRSAEEMDLAQAQVTAILRSLHGLQTGATNDFMIQNQADILSTVEQATGTFTVLLAFIAGISLLVGGIGIMNIMLVSVTERTHEIGLRKAVGAKRTDILVQFLIEAVVVSVLGGIIGVIVGIGAARLITPLLGNTQTLVTPWSVLLALGISLVIGLFFGIYPAGRAASLNPIDALRYE